MMIKAARVVFISLFLSAAALPLIQQHLQLIQIPPLQENRKLKKMPTDWMSLFQSGMSFSEGFNDYFNDNYGFRDFLIRAKNQIDYRLFRKSEKVFIGRSGFLFYKSVVEKDEVGIERMTASDWETLYSRILRLNRVLASRGITLIMIPCPMKNSIYPEMVPPNAPRRPNPTNFQRYLAFLHAHPEIVTLDPTPLLLNLKSSMQVFCRTDFHWTDGAAAYVARELVRKLGNLSGKKELWNESIPITLKEVDAGGESDAMALLWKTGETLPYPAGERLDNLRGEYSKESNAYEWTYTSKCRDKSKLLPDTVMFGDSFSDGWVRAGFTGHFIKVQRFYNWEFQKNFKNIPSGTRYMILQHCETIGMLHHTPFWPEELRNN